MIERHIVSKAEGDESRLVIGPPPTGYETAVASLRVYEDHDLVAEWVLGPESARALVEEIRMRAGRRIIL